MKLSTVKGKERTFDALGDLLEPIASIAMDEDVNALLKRMPMQEGESNVQYFVRRVIPCAKAMVKGHKDDLCIILATLAGQTVEEYAANMTLVSLTKDTIEMLKDEEVKELFTFAQTAE